MGLPISDFQIRYSEEIILKEFGDKVSILATARPLTKFGKNLDVNAGTEETIWLTGGDETYATANIIDTISSSSVSDTTVMFITGHTIDANGDFTRVDQTALLDGQNKVLLTTPLARVERMYNNNATDYIGNIYVYEDDTIVLGVPQTVAKIHLTIRASDNQSLKAAFTTDKNDYAICTALTISVNRQNASVADFKIQIRRKGKVFRSIYTAVVNSVNGTTQLMFPQPIIIPPNSDVKVVAEVSANNTGVEAIMHCYLAEKTYRNV